MGSRYAIYLGSSIKQIPGSDTELTIYDPTISNEELHPLIALQLELWLLIASMAYTIKLLEVIYVSLLFLLVRLPVHVIVINDAVVL